MLHPCFVYDTICFMCLFIQYLAFSGTNLLTRCHSANSCFLLFLYFRKVVEKIFSELNGTNCQHLIIMRGRLCQKMTGGGSDRWPDPTPARPALGPRQGGVWANPSSPDSASSPIYSPIRENPRETRNIPQKVPSPPSSTNPSREGSGALPGTLSEGEITAGVLLHRHAMMCE